jgi:large subunit ribosomal protein L29
MSKRKEALGRIRDLPDDELGQAHERAREELFRLKLGNYTNQVENTVSVRHKRRELARIITIQRARGLSIETQAQPGAATERPMAKAAKPAKPAKPAKSEKKPAAKKSKAEKAPAAKVQGKKKSGKEG